MSNSLVIFSRAAEMLAEANTIQKTKELKDIALTAADWAKRRNMGENAVQHARTYALLAERKMGELLLGMEMAKGGQPYHKKPTCCAAQQVETPTIAQLRLKRTEVAEAKALATVGEEKFQEVVSGAKSVRQVWKEVAREKKNSVIAEKARKSVTKTSDDLDALLASGQKFSTIYADPPWAYGNQGTRAATSNHYSTMSVDDICDLPIKDLKADDAHLHLWTTNAFLFESKRVMEAWGFEYKSMLIWVKPQMGLGNYWRVSHEILLFGISGQCPFLDHSYMSWISCERTRHSKKPEQIRSMIEKVSPPDYLELFGREIIEGWTVWGNEVEGNLLVNECV